MNHMRSRVPEKTAERILDYLSDQQAEMVDFLRQLTLAESPSDVPASQAEVLQLLSDFLGDIEFVTERIPGRQTGGSLSARKQSDASVPNQLLVGHCDTVWPKGSVEQMPVEVSDGKLKGPGVYDMKSGLAQMLYALRALHVLGLEPSLSPVVFVNTDEEIGSGESHAHITRLAKEARRVFVLEPSLGPLGKLKTARKSVGQFTVVVKGKAAHAGLDPEAGVSAIAELASVIQKLFALNDASQGTTVNVGMIEGGLRPNVVAPESKAAVDVRVLTKEEGQRVEAAIRNLQPTTPQTTIEVTGGMGRPPLQLNEANRKLWELARDLGKQIGLELENGTAGGGSDGNFTSQFTATLDGLGGVGDGAHALHEHVRVDDLPRRSALLTLLLLAPDVHSSDDALL